MRKRASKWMAKTDCWWKTYFRDMMVKHKVSEFLFSSGQPKDHNNPVITMFIAFPKNRCSVSCVWFEKMHLFNMVAVNLSTRDDSRVGSRRTGRDGTGEFKKQTCGCSSCGTTLLQSILLHTRSDQTDTLVYRSAQQNPRCKGNPLSGSIYSSLQTLRVLHHTLVHHLKENAILNHRVEGQNEASRFCTKMQIWRSPVQPRVTCLPALIFMYLMWLRSSHLTIRNYITVLKPLNWCWKQTRKTHIKPPRNSCRSAKAQHISATGLDLAM